MQTMRTKISIDQSKSTEKGDDYTFLSAFSIFCRSRV